MSTNWISQISFLGIHYNCAYSEEIVIPRCKILANKCETGSGRWKKLTSSLNPVACLIFVFIKEKLLKPTCYLVNQSHVVSLIHQKLIMQLCHRDCFIRNVKSRWCTSRYDLWWAGCWSWRHRRLRWRVPQVLLLDNVESLYDFFQRYCLATSYNFVTCVTFVLKKNMKISTFEATDWKPSDTNTFQKRQDNPISNNKLTIFQYSIGTDCNSRAQNIPILNNNIQ